jgi:hypothetical protein
VGVFWGSFSAAIAMHDVAILRITPVEGPWDDSWRPWHGNPLFAPQPANLAVPQAAAWIEGYGLSASGDSSGSGSGGKQQLRPGPASAGGGMARGPPSFAVMLSVLAAMAALGVVGYFVVLQWRMRGWQQLQDDEAGRKATELTNGRRSALD